MKTREERIARQKELLELRDRVQSRLMAIPGVRSVGVGLKEVGGKTTDEIVFRVYVTEKKPPSQVPPGERIPAQIDGFDTDVIVWELDKQAAVDSDRYRPLRGGIQITNGSGYGTLGCFARRNSDSVWVALSNHHVMVEGAPGNDIRIAQPDTGCCCCCVTGYVARVTVSVLGGTVDCAIATLEEDIGKVHDIVEIGTVDGSGLAVSGDIVRKRGRTTNLTTGKIKDVVTESTNDAGVTLTNQILIEPAAGVPDFVLPGDSGSALVNENHEVVGLICRQRGHNGIANPIADVESALNINIPVADTGVRAFDRLTPEAAASVAGGRIRDWERLILDEAKTAHPLGLLVGRHRGEIWDLIQHNREVGLRWQRAQGPAYVAAFERTTRTVGYRVPDAIGGISRTELFLAMAVALERNGSPALRADLRAEAIGWIPRLQRCDTAEALWREYQMLKHEYGPGSG